jgi:hypothetical protein
MAKKQTPTEPQGEKKVPLFTINVQFYGDGSLDFTSFGNKDVAPTVSNLRHMAFGQVITKLFGDLLGGKAVPEIFSLLEHTHLLSGDEE